MFLFLLSVACGYAQKAAALRADGGVAAGYATRRWGVAAAARPP